MHWKRLRETPYPVKLYRAGHCLRNARADAPVLPCIPAGLPHYGTSMHARLISLRSITRSTLASRPRAGLSTRFSKSGESAISCWSPFPGRPNFSSMLLKLNEVEAGIAAPSASLQPHQRHYAHAAIAVWCHWRWNHRAIRPKSHMKWRWQPPIHISVWQASTSGVDNTRVCLV